MPEIPKVCTIINTRFCWILEVDGQSIDFQGRQSAEYFHDHYKSLGYAVIMKEESDRK